MVMAQLKENGWDSAPRSSVTPNDVTNPLSWGWEVKNSVLRMIKNHLWKEFQSKYTKHSDLCLWLKNQLLHEKRCSHNMFGGEWDSQLLACYTELSTILDFAQIGNNHYNYRNPSPYNASNIQDTIYPLSDNENTNDIHNIKTHTTTSDFAEISQLIHDAKHLIFTAGAGMGVDSGLPDFRGNNGFWKAYPMLKEKGGFAHMANPEHFAHNPKLVGASMGIA